MTTLLLPCEQPLLAEATSRAWLDPYQTRDQMVRAAQGHPEPTGEVVVVGWVFSLARRATLLVRHPRWDWLSPGGRLHRDEDPVAGASREIREETGLDLQPVDFSPVCVLGDAAGDRRYGLAYAYLADERANLRPEDGQPAAWYALDELSAFPFSHDLDCLRRVGSQLVCPQDSS